MDKAKATQIRTDLEPVLKAFGEKHGLVLKLLAGKYSPNNVTFKLEVSEIGDGGVVMDSKVTDFLAYAAKWGMKKTDLNRTFKLGSRTFRLVGAAPRKYKMPLLGVDVVTGKPFKFPVADVVHAFAQSAAGGVGDIPPPPKRTEAQILNDIRDVEGRLSPENLTCDGEANRTWVIQEGARLRRRLAELVTELGRKPTDKEIWNL